MLLFESLRQCRGALMVSLSILLCIILGLWFNMIMYLVMILFTIFGRLLRGQFGASILAVCTILACLPTSCCMQRQN